MEKKADVLRFDRWDRVATEVIVVLGWGLATMALVGEPVLRWITDEPPTATVEVDSVGLAALLEGAASYRIHDASPVDRLVLLIPGVLTAAMLGIGAWLIVRFLRDVTGAQPFSSTQVTRLRVLAGMLIAVPVAVSMIDGVVTGVVLRDRFDDGFAASFVLQPGWILAGLLVAAVAQAFAVGTRQRRDLEGLI